MKVQDRRALGKRVGDTSEFLNVLEQSIAGVWVYRNDFVSDHVWLELRAVQAHHSCELESRLFAIVLRTVNRLTDDFVTL